MMPIGKPDSSAIFYSDNKFCIGATTADANYAIHTAENVGEEADILFWRNELTKQLGFSGLVTLKQTHSDIVHSLTRDNLSHYLADPLIEGDGIISDLPGILIGVLTADCIPILFTDEQTGVYAAVHAGWKGVYSQIHLKTVRRLIEEFRVDIGRLQVVIGPHIRDCCYEVDAAFIERFNSAGVPLTVRDGRYVSLESAVIADLTGAGVARGRIETVGLCTKCSREPKFFSYRNGDTKGRMLSFAGRKE